MLATLPQPRPQPDSFPFSPFSSLAFLFPLLPFLFLSSYFFFVSRIYQVAQVQALYLRQPPNDLGLQNLAGLFFSLRVKGSSLKVGIWELEETK